MITKIYIKNYALIEEAELFPETGFHAITGETGAGKSILMEALGLIMGERIDHKSIITTAQKCVVEVNFLIQDYDLKAFFQAHDFEYQPESVIRREISPAGKSRIFLNDQPATLESIQELCLLLIDIHLQNQTSLLGNSDYQVEILDVMSSAKKELEAYQNLYKELKILEKKKDELIKAMAKTEKEKDFLSFIVKELNEANLEKLNQTELETELQTIENADAIKKSLQFSLHILEEQEPSVTSMLAALRIEMGKIRNFDSQFSDMEDGFTNLYSELKSTAKDISYLQEKIENNPEKAALIKEKLDLLYRLQKKYNCSDITALIALLNSSQENLDKISNSGLELENTVATIKIIVAKITDASVLLSKKREIAVPNLQEKLTKLADYLGMPDASIVIEIKAREMQLNGADDVQFLFSANKGIAPQALRKTASGGEFSRLMFAIKYILAEKTKLPTLIFDEIDTGISGEIALRMAKMMKKMAEKHQIFVITHLPQTAGWAQNHYHVYKDRTGERTNSKIKKLNTQERIEAMAQMIGGENPSENALQSAKELLRI